MKNNSLGSLVFDIEANGLNPDKVWCIVAQDLDTKKIYRYRPDEIEKGLKFLIEITPKTLDTDIKSIKKAARKGLEEELVKRVDEILRT